MENSASAKVLIVGCGDLGGEVARQLVHVGISVTGVRRSGNVIADHSVSSTMQIIAADVTKPESLAALNTVQPDILIYCVAASGQTDAEYKSAYVDGLCNVLAMQKSNSQLKHVFFVSSTRVYGQDTQAVLDESVPALPADFGGQRLLEAEHLLQTLSCGATVLRLSGIYGPGRLRMLNLAKSPGSWPKQNIWSNRIHRDDAAAFMVFLVKQVLAGNTVQNCFIVTDSSPVPQYEVLSWLATQLQVGRPEQIPANGGKRLSNKVMLETGFKLQYPDYKAGYRTLLPV
jgi:nucleoside-diphosphate-sugar epimerase